MKFTLEWYNARQGKIVYVNGQRCTITSHRTESRMGSYERGLAWSHTTWAMLRRNKDRCVSMNHGATWHASARDAMKSKGKLKLNSKIEKEFAFEGIQRINRDYDPGFVWHR